MSDIRTDAVTSADGTAIVFDRSGVGPAVILVAGSLMDRADPILSGIAAGLARGGRSALRQASCRCAGGTSLVRIKIAIRIAPPAAGLIYGSNDAPRRSSSSSHGSCPPGKGIPGGARYSRISHPRNQEEDREIE